MRRRDLLAALVAASVAAGTRGVRAERALTIIVPDSPGDAAGAVVRVLQPYLERSLARPVVLDFRPGAGGIVGLTAGAQAPADGVTLTLLTPAVTLAPAWFRKCHSQVTPEIDRALMVKGFLVLGVTLI